MNYPLIRPLLFALDPEMAHRAAIAALRSGVLRALPVVDSSLRRRVLGLDFPNPIGIAAGFDKNGEAVDGLLGLGFGFVEVGTVTPLPQAGNPMPRMFRLTGDRAIINRLGFNNEGHDAVHRRLAERKRAGIVGVNLGANRDSSDRVADYVAGVRRFADIADYLVVNVSSPNTPGLRDLQERQSLTRLLAAVIEARNGAGRRVPLLLKIAPDLDDTALAAIAEKTAAAGVDGLIATNTTTARDDVSDARLAAEAGGLSGRPLFDRSTRILAKLRRLVGDGLVLIGVGGVDSAATARQKLDAGADLVQLYTGMIYEGPDLPARIVAGLVSRGPETPGRS
jgi:dihydroorotate dehydrogenase